MNDREQVTALTPDDLARIEELAEQTKDRDGIVSQALRLAAAGLRTLQSELERNQEGWSVAFHAAVSHQEARERLTAEVATLNVRIIKEQEEHVSAVRSRDEELAVVKQQRSDNLKAIADRDARITKAEKILLGGLGQSWSRVVDQAILALRGAGD